MCVYTYINWLHGSLRDYRWSSVCVYFLQCSCLENPRDREAWWASVYGVAQSRTRLKWLSSSSSSSNVWVWYFYSGIKSSATLIWYLLSPSFYRCGNRLKKENKNSVSFSTWRLILSLTHSRCSVNGHWMKRDILLIPVQGFPLKSVWLQHSCCSQYHMMKEEGILFFFPTLIINQWDINICILSVNKTYVYCYYFGKHPNIKACFLVQNITSTSLTGYHTYMVGQAFSALNKWNIFAPDSKQ